MTSECRRELVQDFYTRLWNSFDRSRIEALLDRAVVFRGSLGRRVVGHDGFASYMDEVESFAPDFHNRIDQLIAGDDETSAAVRLTWTGTARGAALGCAPNGRAFTYTGVALFRFGGERITSVEVYGDLEGLRRQLARERAGPAPSAAIVGPGPGDPSAVEALLRTLPAWFGIESALLDYAASSAKLDTWTISGPARRPGVASLDGVLCLARPSPICGEIHVMAVHPDRQRQGLGRELVTAAEDHLRAAGVPLIQVKTLAPSHPDPGYAKTRAFYEGLGYQPFEDLPTLWGEANPCRVYVKLLAPRSAEDEDEPGPTT